MVLAIDVRSPSEFSHAKIPGAISLPLFSDEERATVGTPTRGKAKTLPSALVLNCWPKA